MGQFLPRTQAQTQPDLKTQPDPNPDPNPNSNSNPTLTLTPNLTPTFWGRGSRSAGAWLCRVFRWRVSATNSSGHDHSDGGVGRVLLQDTAVLLQLGTPEHYASFIHVRLCICSSNTVQGVVVALVLLRSHCRGNGGTW